MKQPSPTCFRRGVVETVIKKLLLVDDDLSQLAARKIILELSGYAVLTAADPISGMQLFEAGTPDVVVLDYEMSTDDGGVLADKIRRVNGAIPIVMVHSEAHSAIGSNRCH